MKTTLLKIISCFILSILVVAGLFAWSHYKLRKDNGFERKLPDTKIIDRIKTVALNSRYYYFAGNDHDTIYLSNYMAPLHMIKVVLPDMDTIHIRLRLENENNIPFRKDNQVNILPPYFYYMDGINTTLMRGELHKWYATRFMYDSAYFSSAVPIGQKSVAIKAINARTRERIIGIEKNEKPHISLHPEILEKQIDGIFCTDGQLLYNKDRKQLIYIYNYRNQYTVMDRDGNLLYRANTIDTISKAMIKPASLEDGKIRKLASPPFIVNGITRTAKNNLYVNSTLIARNESPQIFTSHSTIDVYDLSNGTYKFSFHIPYYNKIKTQDYWFTDNYLVGINKGILVTYKYNKQLFKMKN